MEISVSSLIQGTVPEGVIEVREGKVLLIREREPGVQQVEAVCDRDIFRDFIEQVEGKSRALIGPRDTFDVTEACLLARLSADEGRVVAFAGERDPAP